MWWKTNNPFQLHCTVSLVYSSGLEYFHSLNAGGYFTMQCYNEENPPKFWHKKKIVLNKCMGHEATLLALSIYPPSSLSGKYLNTESPWDENSGFFMVKIIWLNINLLFRLPNMSSLYQFGYQEPALRAKHTKHTSSYPSVGAVWSEEWIYRSKGPEYFIFISIHVKS